MLATVETISDRKVTVRMDESDSGNNRKQTFLPRQFPSIDHGYPVTIRRAQGCNVDRSFDLSSQTLDHYLTLFAMKRHREETGFYTALDVTRKLRLMPDFRDSRTKDNTTPAPSGSS